MFQNIFLFRITKQNFKRVKVIHFFIILDFPALNFPKNVFLLQYTIHSYKSVMLTDLFKTLYFPNLNCPKMGFYFEIQSRTKKS